MKNRTIACICFLVASLLAACAPSQQAVQTAIAETQAAYTSTPTITPMSTITPKPTATLRPIPTVTPIDTSALVIKGLLNAHMIDASKKTGTYLDVADVSYDSNNSGKTLVIKTTCKVITGKCQYAGMAAVIDGLSTFLLIGILDPLPEDLAYFEIIGYDESNTEIEHCSGKWSNMVAFSYGQITSSQFMSRLTILK